MTADQAEPDSILLLQSQNLWAKSTTGARHPLVSVLTLTLLYSSCLNPSHAFKELQRQSEGAPRWQTVANTEQLSNLLLINVQHIIDVTAI